MFRQKKIISVFILAIITITMAFSFFPVTAHCDTPLDLKNPLDGPLKGQIDLPKETEADKSKEEMPEISEADIDEQFKGASFMERIIASVFSSITTGIYHILGMKDPLELIFDYGSSEKYVSRDNLSLGIFNDAEMSVIAVFYNTFQVYMPLWILIATVLVGFLLIFAGFGGDPRLTAKQYISGILLTCTLLVFGPNLIDFVFTTVYTFVDVIKNVIERTASAKGLSIPNSMIGLLLEGFLRDASTGAKVGLGTTAYFLPVVAAITSLPYAIALLLIFIGGAILNWQYIVRKITLAVLIFMFPFVAGMAVFPNTRGALKMWFAEFFSNVFLVLAHAMVYGFLIMIFLTKGSTGEPVFSVLEVIIFMVGLNGTVGLVRGMFNANQGKSSVLGSMGNILGVSSLMGLGKTVMGMKGGLGGLAGGGIAKDTAGKAASVGASAGTSAAGGLTPHQKELINAQMAGTLTDEQKMELSGPQQHLSQDRKIISPEKQKKLDENMKKAENITAGAMGLGGALVSGMVSGQAGAGIGAGIELGKKLGENTLNTKRNLGKLASNPNSMGIYSASQFLDPKSVRAIGERFGGAGKMVAGAVNRATLPYRAVASVGQVLGNAPTVASQAKSIRNGIEDTYVTAQKNYNSASFGLQAAEENMKKYENYTEQQIISDPILNFEHMEASSKLASAKESFNNSEISFKEAEIRRNNKDDYVGIQLKMNSLNREQMRSSGGII